jgi:triacylglycerol esterase/lipase EstA (alpha/beta hydrolase family)
LSTVEISTGNGASQEYDATTGTWTSTASLVFSGPARIQPVTAITETSDTYNPTFLKTVRVQLSYNSNTVEGATTEIPDIRPNDRMRVTASNNQSLTKFLYVVTDVLNSSNAWERTLLCKVDTELDPTFTGA